MKKNLSSVLLITVFLVGLSLLLYPTVSDYWNSFHQSRAIASYAEAVSQMDNDRYEKIRLYAVKYNSDLFKSGNIWQMNEQQLADYEQHLKIVSGGIMGYIEIPKIKCSLPIYHGTDDSVLQIAVGHIAGSSLPIGGDNTHSVLSGHRGLPSAKLFTNLDKLVVGDFFQIRVLDEILTYEVDQVLIVLPSEIEPLKIEKGKDLCTLVTCTPYGINSHRLLVRGHRVENPDTDFDVRVTADALQVDPMIVAPFVALPMLLALLVVLLVKTRKRR